MKVKILISILILAFCVSGFAQEYYRWYRGEKVPLELMPTRKFILLASPDDTLALKNKLTEQHIRVYPFEVTQNTRLKDKYIDRENDCWTIIEGENLPDFTSEESVLYEVPGFKLTDTGLINNEVCPSHLFYVRLFQDADFTALQNLASENNVTIRGSMTLTFWYLLECSKESAGNTLQMANLFYETGLFAATEAEFRTFGTFTLGNETGIVPLSSASSGVYIDTQNADNVTIDSENSCIANIQIFDIDGRKIFESSYLNDKQVSLNLSGQKGVYLFKIKLHSGDVICRKTVIK